MYVSQYVWNLKLEKSEQSHSLLHLFIDLFM